MGKGGGEGNTTAQDEKANSKAAERDKPPAEEAQEAVEEQRAREAETHEADERSSAEEAAADSDSDVEGVALVNADVIDSVASRAAKTNSPNHRH